MKIYRETIEIDGQDEELTEEVTDQEFARLLELEQSVDIGFVSFSERLRWARKGATFEAAESAVNARREAFRKGEATNLTPVRW